MPSYCPDRPPFHVAIIMDGNGRWATKRGLDRTFGHRAGAEAMRRTVLAAPDFGITTLTFFAFSSYNWGRAPREVDGLMRLLSDYLAAETETLARSGARLSLIGRRDRLPIVHRERLERIESRTAGGKRLHVRIAVDYSAREAIEQAARTAGREPHADVGRLIAQTGFGDGAEAQNVDLLIRTGGDRRLSDFLLWECAFAELCFMGQMWPDFDRCALAAAIADFKSRERASVITPYARLAS